MVRKIILLILLIAVIAGFVFFSGKKTEKIEDQIKITENQLKTIEVGKNSFTISFPTDYIELKIGEEYILPIKVDILGKTSAKVLVGIAPAGIEVLTNGTTLQESGVIEVKFKISKYAQLGLNKILMILKDDFGNEKEFWITINILS
ncbi:MAG: hypothetical protein QW038_01215 [Nanopusillaceae archaeon]